MHSARTRTLLTAGLVAGPVVLAVGLSLAALTPGFDWRRHASSQLALGAFGWVQSLNFIVAGLLLIAFALGMRHALTGRRGGLWAPLLMLVFAVSHVMVGVFATDPAFGFPPGSDTPVGAPDMDSASLSARLHNLFGFLGFNALAAGSAVMAAHFGRARRGWALLSLLVTAVILAVGAYAASWEMQHAGPSRRTAQFDFGPMWAGLPLIWGYVTALAWRLRRDLKVAPTA